jgi:hypothetical protein
VFDGTTPALAAYFDDATFSLLTSRVSRSSFRSLARQENPDMLTVVLPQSMSAQPPESRELLKEVQNVIEMSENDDMSLMDASRLCNEDIIARVDQVVCILFHDSSLLLETCREAKESSKIVTLFYLD